MKNTTFILILLFSSFTGVAQEEVAGNDRDWLFEVEPSAFVLKGFGVQVGRNLTKDNKLSTSLYCVGTDVPEMLRKSMFSNTDIDDRIRLPFQIALNTRYKFELFKNRASNPYVGLVTGWEYFEIKNENKENLTIDVFVCTPYIGGEIYFYKDMLYVNPQVRSVIYVAPSYSVENRPEKLKKAFLLPQISLGLRI